MDKDELLNSLPGAIKGGLGLAQLLAGSLMKPKRPEYKIPKEIGEGLAISRQSAFARDPGTSSKLEAAEGQGATAFSRLQKTAGSSNQVLAGLAGIQASTNAAERSILGAEASDRFRRMQNYQRSLTLMGQYKDKEFQINKMDPFDAKAATKSALMGGGLQNLFGGSGDIAKGIAQQRYNDQLMKLLNG